MIRPKGGIDTQPPSLPAAAPTADPQDARHFADWDRYRLVRLLGQGGMGTVYLARDCRLDRDVALKFIRGAEPRQSMRLLQEARAQARVVHDNVCQVHEAGEYKGRSYIAMQYIEGEPLTSAAAQMTLHEKVQVLRDIALGLHEAHALGILHRDVKPGNILLEHTAQGGLRPVIMDFGLARQQSEERGLTETGAVLGTPAYMSPEQARGAGRSLDRRSDVYSLGATAYELLCGAPPFEAQNTYETLQQVLYQDPPPLRARAGSIPEDLETIVLKCLAKEPGRRYDSARALADDLLRYIRGEAIVGRKASWAYRLRRRAGRHRALVITAALALGGISVAAGLGLRARVALRQQVALAQHFTEEAIQIEAIMQRAHLLPLHNLARERALVAEHLGRLTREMRAAGAVADGPGHYALGRGYLALADYKSAREHLLLAERSGYTAAGLDYALGRTLAEFYRRELTVIEQSADEGSRAARTRELEHSYLTPALARLSAYVRSAPSGEAHAADYVEALLAFYRKDYAQALAKAQAAFAQLPWLYEARVLAGEVYLERGKLHVDHAEFPASLTDFASAGEEYRQASELGRSDPAVHVGTATVWIQTQGAMSLGMGRDPGDAFAQMRAACERALVADPDDADAYQRLLWGYRWLVQYQEALHQGSAVAEGVAAAERAIARFPQRADFQLSLGSLHQLAGVLAKAGGRDPRPAFERAVQASRAAIALSSQESAAHLFDNAHAVLSRTYRAIGGYTMDHGGDPRAAFAQALAEADKLRQLPQVHPESASERTMTLHWAAAYELKHGRDPRPLIDQGIQAARAGVQLNPAVSFSRFLWINLLVTQAEDAMLRGADPQDALRAAEEVLAAARAGGSADSIWIRWQMESRLYRAQAAALLQSGVDPAPAIERSREAIQKWRVLQSAQPEPYAHRCAIESIAVRWALQRKQDARSLLASAEEAATQALSRQDDSSGNQRLAAEVDRLRAEQELGAGRSPAAAIARGLLRTARALAIDADNAEALVSAGALHLLDAQAAPEPRRAAAQRARTCFDQAFAKNPLLEREYGPLRKKAALWENGSAPGATP